MAHEPTLHMTSAPRTSVRPNALTGEHNISRAVGGACALRDYVISDGRLRKKCDSFLLEAVVDLPCRFLREYDIRACKVNRMV